MNALLIFILAAIEVAHDAGMHHLAMDEEACFHYQIPDPGWLWKLRVYAIGFIRGLCHSHNSIGSKVG